MFYQVSCRKPIIFVLFKTSSKPFFFLCISSFTVFQRKHMILGETQCSACPPHTYKLCSHTTEASSLIYDSSDYKTNITAELSSLRFILTETRSKRHLFFWLFSLKSCLGSCFLWSHGEYLLLLLLWSEQTAAGRYVGYKEGGPDTVSIARMVS